MREKNTLTAREIEILTAIGDTGTAQGVADDLGIGHETVRSTLATIRAKLGARNTTHAFTLAYRAGLVRRG